MIPANNKIDDFAEQLVKSIWDGNASFLVGAGVSMQVPSSLPSGKKLKEIVLETLLIPNYAEEINILRTNKQYNNIIPEVLFSEMYFAIQMKIFPIFKILELAEPNRIHEILAKIYLEFKTPIFTTNFDLLIDRFLPDNKIFHLHGHLDNIQEIYILLKQIIRGTPIMVLDDIMQHLQSRNLFVIGYSGNDKDVVDLIDKSSVSRVFWLIKPQDKVAINNINGIKNKKVIVYEGDIIELASIVYKKIPSLNDLQSKSRHIKYENIEDKKNEIIENYRTSVSEYEVGLLMMRVCHRIGLYNRSIEIGKKLLKYKSLNKDEYYRTCVLISDLLRLSPGGYDEALQLLNKIIKNRKSKESIAYAEILNGKAVIILNRSNFKNPYYANVALKILNKAIYFLKRDKNKLDKNRAFNRERYKIVRAFIFQNIGLAYFHLKAYNNSKKYFTKSLYLKRELSHLNGIVSSCRSLTILSYAMKSKSYIYWEKTTMELIEKYSHIKYKIEFYRDLGELMIYLGERIKAKETLTKALILAENELKESRHKIEIKNIIDSL